MKIKIRTMAVMMTAAMMIGLTGCGAEKTPADVTVQEKVTVAEAEAKAEVLEEETVEAEELAETDVTEEQPEEETVDTEVEASEQAAEEESLKAEETAEKVEEQKTEEQKTEEQKTEEQKTEAKKSNIPDWFDAEFYAANNSDVVAALGSGADALYNHYVTYGKAEGRKANADDPTEPVVTANSGNESNNNDSAGSNNSSSVVVDTNIPSYDEFAGAMLAKVNALRREQGVGELTLDEQCKNVSAIRVVEISSLFSHTRPDGRKSSTTWDDLGYQWSGVGENIAKITNYCNTTSSLTQKADVFYDLFKNSPSHYSTMINSKWTKAYFNIYITYNEDGETVYHCVQTFSK